MTKRPNLQFLSRPLMLPLSVLETAASEMTNYKGSGMSVMEMSHRSKVYQSIFDETKANFRRIFHVPDTHEILFMQGGATFQFAAVPLNLMGENGTADYAITGNFSKIASKEAAKYGKVNIACDSSDRNHTYIPAQEDLKLTPGASYFHYCANNTIYGTEWKYISRHRQCSPCLRHVLKFPVKACGRVKIRHNLWWRSKEHGSGGHGSRHN